MLNYVDYPHITASDRGHPALLYIRSHLLRQVHVPEGSRELGRRRLPHQTVLSKTPAVTVSGPRPSHLPQDNRFRRFSSAPLDRRPSCATPTRHFPQVIVALVVPPLEII